jgi:hypothetical protein
MEEFLMAFNPSGLFGAIGRGAGRVGKRMGRHMKERVTESGKRFKKNISKSIFGLAVGALGGGKPKRKVSDKTLSAAQGFKMTPEADTSEDFAQAGARENIATPYSGLYKKPKKKPGFRNIIGKTPSRKKYGNGSSGIGNGVPEADLSGRTYYNKKNNW